MIYDYGTKDVIFENYDDFDEEAYRCKIYDYGYDLDPDEIADTSEYYKLIYRVFILCYAEFLEHSNVYKSETSDKHINIEFTKDSFLLTLIDELHQHKISFEYYVDYEETPNKNFISIDMDNLGDMYAFYY